jgi:hypothetical protein
MRMTVYADRTDGPAKPRGDKAMRGWIVRITTPVAKDRDPLVWEFKMPTIDRDEAILWGRAYQHTLLIATVEAIGRF